MEENVITLSSDVQGIGCVKIADDVVAMIASLAATEVDGVSAMVGNITNELMSKVGMKKLTKGARVDIVDNVVTIDLTVVLEYGFNIPKTCHLVQNKVKNAVEETTGLTVSDVNVRITGIKLPQ